MADGVVSQIELPNGQIYDIKDGNTDIDSTYDSNTKTVTLVVGSLSDADSTEY